MHFTVSLTTLKHKKCALRLCDKAVKDDSSSLQFFPDWFVAREQIDMLYDDYYDDDGDHWDDDSDEDKFFEWYDGYKKRKAQKAKIKKELMPITWYPSRCWDWCVPEDEKRKKKDCQKIVGINLDLFISCDRI